MIDVVHPRPQLTREHWEDLCGTWQFAHDDDERGVSAGWHRDATAFDRTIVVPFPPESQASLVRERGHHPVVWYRRTFRAADLPDDHRLLLHFGAVDYRAEVWINGDYVGGHEGGHSSFSFDITSQLHRNHDHQVVVVRAEDRPTDLTQPRGKQDWHVQPHDIWYHRTTGIWQPVWLERVPDLHLGELHWTPDLDAGVVAMDARLSHPPATPVTVTVTVRRGEAVLAETGVRTTDVNVRHIIALPDVHGPDSAQVLWSPESPTLLDVDVVVRDGDRVLDHVRSYIGMRSAAFGDGRFLLNGLPYYLRMVLEQGYWPESHLAAPSAEALRREVELVKELGFNGVRVHQKVEDPRFLYWCDRLGLLVWGEMANPYRFGPDATRRLVHEWQAVVGRDRSHPCIVTWVPVNESWGVDRIESDRGQQHLASALYHLTKAIDPSRPVISNDGWEHVESDVWTIHDYGTADGLAERYGSAEAVHLNLRSGRPALHRVLLCPDGPTRPVVISEFGGVSFVPVAGQQWFGYDTVADTDELRTRFAALVDALLDSSEIAGFCYTQLTDVEQERNGLLTDDRRPKINPEHVRAVLRRPSRAIATETIDQMRRAVGYRPNSSTG